MVLFCSFKSGSSTQGKDIFLPVRGNSVCLMVCVTIWKRKERVNWLVVLREALWAYIEYKRIPPNPRLGAMTIIPLTDIME